MIMTRAIEEPLLHRAAKDDNMVDPGFEGGRNAKVVHGDTKNDGIGQFQLVNQALLIGGHGDLFGGAQGQGNKHGANQRVADVRGGSPPKSR
jgi:hypothetical protein